MSPDTFDAVLRVGVEQSFRYPLRPVGESRRARRDYRQMGEWGNGRGSAPARDLARRSVPNVEYCILWRKLFELVSPREVWEVGMLPTDVVLLKFGEVFLLILVDATIATGPDMIDWVRPQLSQPVEAGDKRVAAVVLRLVWRIEADLRGGSLRYGGQPATT